jgi:hypothetical protein
VKQDLALIEQFLDALWLERNLAGAGGFIAAGLPLGQQRLQVVAADACQRQTAMVQPPQRAAGLAKAAAAAAEGSQ